ncbi:hypothetical protein SDC9_198496 [bioreactor metagenome]|uniref:Uncharacterized protein n=1 Tax=bioreactor metagenome TaxID=1076179 RepID=A0A645IIP4_9ZZZZ
MFPEITENFINKKPFLSENQIESFNMWIKRSNGEKFMKVRTVDGKIFIKIVAPNGIISNEYIGIPPYYTTEQRDELVKYLRQTRDLFKMI